MRPHLLELRAFGAFPGEVRLDLDAIGENGLVLLCGDTGGGKTTLLDALGFALYGVVPGERHKAREDLRSHHAAEGLTAWARLEFTARGRRLRVTRTPVQTRPKKRGEGVITENPTALLESWDGSTWSPLAQRPEDVGFEIGRLLGIDASQFFQVVILPQGGFAAFLQADHKDREKLLKQLFHVDRFEHVERWLVGRAADAVADVEKASGQLHLAAARLGQAAGVEAPEDLEAAGDWALELAAGAEQARAQAAVVVDRQLTARTLAQGALADAEQLAAQQQARRLAEAEHDRLAAQSAELAALQLVRDAAERARPVQVALDAYDTAEAALRQAEEAARTALALVELLQVTTPLCPPDPSEQDGSGRGSPGSDSQGSDSAGSDGAGSDGFGQVVPTEEAALRRLAAWLHTEGGRLEALIEVASRAEEAEIDAVAAARLVEQLGEALAAVLVMLAELPAAREQAQQQAEAAAAADRLLPEARHALAQAVAAFRLSDEAAQLTVGQRALAAELLAAVATAEQARAVATAVRQQRLEALVAELAATLVEGAACQVCGATEHPDVAELHADHVSKDAEDAAEQQARAAEDVRHSLDRQAAALAERLAGIVARLDPSPVAVPVLAAQVSELEVAVAAGGPALATLATLQAETERCQGEVVRLETRQVEQRKREAEAAATAATLRARLLAELGEGVHLATRRRELASLAEAATAAAEALARASSAHEVGRAAELTLTKLLAAAGFSDQEVARAACREQEWLVSTTALLSAHREQLAAVQARLAELEVALEPPAPVAECRQAAEAAAAAYEDAYAHERVAAGRCLALTALLTPYAEALAMLAPLRQVAAEVKGLAEVTAGRGVNRLSMPLSTYVLAARLEEVAQSASLRLARMSGGRYTLTHTDEGRDKRRRAGLGLQVEDGWTGRSRDTATLSGGETFMTALSLALGLADVVTAESGGRTIDALFIDEGFGTLDAASLDQVMDVLDELRTGGRLVGVVSHVADLKLRIPAQINVLKGENGSRVELR